MSSFVIKTTGCAFNTQYVRKSPHQFLWFLHPLPPSFPTFGSLGSRAAIPLWIHTFLHNAELRNRATAMETGFYNSLHASVRIYVLSLLILALDRDLGLIRNHIVYWIRLITAHPLLKEIHTGFCWISSKMLSFHYLLSKNVCLFLPFFFTI